MGSSLCCVSQSGGQVKGWQVSRASHGQWQEQKRNEQWLLRTWDKERYTVGTTHILCGRYHQQCRGKYGKMSADTDRGADA